MIFEGQAVDVADEYSNLSARHRPYATKQALGLQQRPASTSMPLVHTEVVSGQIK
jgi:hypothetical protein